ncbi:PilZ domain-containing protein [bacterium]|jgi:hypothetical protein|nr:PilZ domain-containing protein [bacterium]
MSLSSSTSESVRLSTSPVGPETIATAVDNLLSQLPTAGMELRTEDRHAYSRQVQVTKDNKTELCAGKDLSHGGVGFLHTRPILGNVIVGLTSPNGDFYRFLAEVVRARQVGRFYEIGARFLERIS